MKRILYIAALVAVTGCTHPPKDLLQPDQSTLAIRQAQSRVFNSCTDKQLLRASVSVLQDMGYSIKESVVEYGVLTAIKEADATSAGQVALALASAFLGGTVQPIDRTQHITVTMVILDKAAPNQASARTTFQRVVVRSDNSCYAHAITDQEVYQEFYEKLDKSLFLEVNNV